MAPKKELFYWKTSLPSQIFTSVLLVEFSSTLINENFFWKTLYPTFFFFWVKNERVFLEIEG